MAIHLVNPSDNSFGTAVITPRWLFVLAAATPQSMGDPILVDESLEQLNPEKIQAGDVVGISVHTGNALRGYAVGKLARFRGATVVYGGIHATLFPEEPFERGAAHAVVRGDGDVVWRQVLRDIQAGCAKRIYEGGKIEGDEFLAARWDLMQTDKYMWASVQTIRGCPKHCSFCSVWRTDGQKPRQRSFERVIDEIIDLRRRGFRFIALADDNFYPVTLTDLRLAREQNNLEKQESLTQIRAERFSLMAELAKLPKDMVFFTQITMESAEDPEYLDAMRRANIKGALVGVEAVTPEGLKAVYKDFNFSGDRLIEQLQTFRKHGVHVLGSFIFGLPTDKPSTFDATVELALKAGVTFAQFVMMTPFPGTVDFARWEREQAETPMMIEGTPITRYWLIPTAIRPKMFTPHPLMSSDEIRERTQGVWDRFYEMGAIWKRSTCTPTFRARLAFVLSSILYRQMYAGTGISTDSARRKKAKTWARWIARQTRKVFQAKPMPELTGPVWEERPKRILDFLGSARSGGQTSTAMPSAKVDDHEMKENPFHSLEALRDSLLSGEMPQSLRWNHAVELIEHLGQVEGHGDNEFAFVVGEQRAIFKRPDDHVLELKEVARLRKFLRDAGPGLVVQAPAQPLRIVVVIDHHAAHIYQDFGGIQSTDEYTVRPHNPFNIHHHVVHDHGGHSRAERVSEENLLYEDVARELHHALEIVILGHGKGASEAATGLNEYLQSHHTELFRRVVVTDHADSSTSTEAAIDALAKKYMLAVA